MLAEAERGMLVHCCCFVVNLVRGYAAARLCWTLFYQVCQLASPVVEETYFDSFTHSGPQISESTEVRLYFFFIIYFFREDVLTFLSKLLEFSR